MKDQNPVCLKNDVVWSGCRTNTSSCVPAVPSEPPQNVRAISVTSDEAVITWAEPPRLTLHGVLKGYRVVFWSLFPDGGGCCGGQAQWPMQSNYHLSHSKLLQQPTCPTHPTTHLPACSSVSVVSRTMSVLYPDLFHKALPVPLPLLCSSVFCCCFLVIVDEIV